MAEPSPSAPVKSAMRTLDIIEYVVARDRPTTAQEIATALAIPVSSLSYLLATLADRGYLTRDGRRYAAGPALGRLAQGRAEPTLAERAAPLVKALRTQLNETASFFVPNGWEAEALVTEPSEHALRYAVMVGARAPLHALSAGKALLAELSEEDLARYFAETTRTAFTPATVTDETAIRATLRAAREEKVARSCEEHVAGLVALGRAARVAGRVVGAFSVAIPTVRFDAAVERRVSEALIRTAALLDR